MSKFLRHRDIAMEQQVLKWLRQNVGKTIDLGIILKDSEGSTRLSRRIFKKRTRDVASEQIFLTSYTLGIFEESFNLSCGSGRSKLWPILNSVKICY
jgi:hypothetical protein